MQLNNRRHPSFCMPVRPSHTSSMVRSYCSLFFLRTNGRRTDRGCFASPKNKSKRHGDADQMPQMWHWRTLDSKGMLQEIEEGLKLGLPRTGRYLCWPPVSQTFQIMHRVSQNYCLLSCYINHVSRSARNIGHLTNSKVQIVVPSPV